MQADLLREKFLDFFKSRKHKIVESDSLAPKDDPTVLFTPAGMNQFKKEFLGKDSGFRRAATAQRCLRTDDLDKVGKTPAHHTLFEMLGNFSFGDYFKKEAIRWAWEFLTEELKIPQQKLWVSVYKDDQEAYQIWRDDLKVPEAKIVKLGDKENFWPSEAKTKGPNGPCGPCSEIFFDFGKDAGCGRPDCDPGCGCNRFTEIWNLVFTQFNRKEDGALEPLPQKNIDTGMGLERLAAVMQGATNNFETDLFRPIIKEIADNMPRSPNLKSPDICAIADHIRAISFAIYDGVIPSNEDRGYVIRKIIRKSVLHLRALGIKQPFLYKLVPVLSEIMKKPYPELDKQKEDIAANILAEEKSFISILNSSDKYLIETFTEPYNTGDSEKVASLIFKLTDTYGLPLNIITDWLERHGGIPAGTLELYNDKVNEQRQRSRAQSAMKGDVFSSGNLHLAAKETKFLGYKDSSVSAKIIQIIGDEGELNRIDKGKEVRIILDKTVFYPESGGQIGDQGELSNGNNRFKVSDTLASGKVIIHIGKVTQGTFNKDDAVEAKINTQRRMSISRNHTATHLLQAALRKVLGPHVKQQGSLVADERLRFDFTHFKGITQDEINRIEDTVNSYIKANHRVSVKELDLKEAKKEGALAFFGEKYEDKVRVVSIGDFSKELCGGAHLDSPEQIGLFRITQEASVASGIRRIEAVTGDAAYKKVKEEKEIIDNVVSLLNVPPDKIAVELEKRLSQVKSLEKQLAAHKLSIAKGSVEELIEAAGRINNIKFICRVLEGADMDLLRKTIDLIKEKVDNSVIVLAAKKGQNAVLVMGITQDLVRKGLDASGLIRDVSGIIGGSGGGRKDFAQAGGSKPENLEKAFEELKEKISKLK